MSELISATNLQISPEDWRTAGGRLLCFACCLFRQFVSAHCPPEFSNLLCPSVFSCLLTKIFGAGAVFFFSSFLLFSLFFLARAAQLGACSTATHSDKGRLKDKDTACHRPSCIPTQDELTVTARGKSTKKRARTEGKHKQDSPPPLLGWQLPSTPLCPHRAAQVLCVEPIDRSA